jgi:CDP-glucose 4,6-dehydratase
MFGGVYHKRRCLITGNTGFKGSWLGFWLSQLGAQVCGVSLPAEKLSHFGLLEKNYETFFCDIRDLEKLKKVFSTFQPEIVFHLAAQPLVRLSYREPVDTFSANLMGTVNLLECCRLTESVRSAVIITTDKCYENPETGVPFKETDPLGGYDPYSSSKAAAEIAVSSYNRSFFLPEGRVGCASARAGNVIGGGDWAADRLIPDLVRGAASGKVAKLRNPGAVRPWQHLLEPLSGYLWLGSRLFEEKEKFSGSWNFGPALSDTLTVGEVAERMNRFWDKMRFEYEEEPNAPHEAALLRLDCSKAAEELQWQGIWNAEKAIEYTVGWYRNFYENNTCLTADDLARYCRDAEMQGAPWTR